MITALFSVGFGIWKIDYDEKQSNQSQGSINSLLKSNDAVQKKLDNQTIANNALRQQFDSIRKDNTELKDQLRGLGKQGEENTNKLLSNAPKIEQGPILDLCPTVHGNRSNPLTEFGTDTNHVSYIISICNTGNSHAFNIADKTAFVYNSGSHWEFGKPMGQIANKSLQIAPNSMGFLFPVYLTFFPNVSSPSDLRMFLYFGLSYTNEKGKNRRTINRIFEIKNKIAIQVNASTYNEVANQIKKKNLWKH
jgi:hypothetical protein